MGTVPNATEKVDFVAKHVNQSVIGIAKPSSGFRGNPCLL